MSADVRKRTRDVARAAVRADLAKVAFDLFRVRGFDAVTISDVAAAAGVSRNTFMRYFETKEDAVLGVFETNGRRVAEALSERPRNEDDWTALRKALDVVVQEYRADPVSALDATTLIQGTPSLLARRLQKRSGWRPLLTEVLTGRGNCSDPTALPYLVRAAAALDCLDIAVDYWAAAGGDGDLGEFLDSAFEAIAPS
ncbi:TetR/AcrR family transcriptional regulator [Rhodococcus erythropolis]|uniref:TetR/AcrR family transcriptional regulator n=1 Tax=Rhodococcus erythropolis TaxID=1833 RepID=UPI002225E57C|nr:TetR/AcrR family transcriptional regulator [Rhodococcus erythropolis]MCW2295444.1 AcrR family transcriptional regulator [Rhodococcus erythropolis]